MVVTVSIKVLFTPIFCVAVWIVALEPQGGDIGRWRHCANRFANLWTSQILHQTTLMNPGVRRVESSKLIQGKKEPRGEIVMTEAPGGARVRKLTNAIPPGHPT